MRPEKLRSELRSQITENQTSKEEAIFHLVSLNNPNCEELLKEHFNNTGTVDLRDSDGLTPLMIAAANNNFSLFSFLIEQGADINAHDHSGHSTEYHARKNDSISIVSAIEGNNVILAASLNNIKWIDQLLSEGSKIDEKDSKGRTPLMIAALTGNRKLCINLLQRGADINAEDDRGLHTFNYTQSSSHPDKSKFLRKVVEEIISSRHTNEERWNEFIHPKNLVGEGFYELRYLTHKTAASLIANIRDSNPEVGLLEENSKKSSYELAEEKIMSLIYDNPEEEDIEKAIIITKKITVIERKEPIPPTLPRPSNKTPSRHKGEKVSIVKPVAQNSSETSNAKTQKSENSNSVNIVNGEAIPTPPKSKPPKGMVRKFGNPKLVSSKTSPTEIDPNHSSVQNNSETGEAEDLFLYPLAEEADDHDLIDALGDRIKLDQLRNNNPNQKISEPKKLSSGPKTRRFSMDLTDTILGSRNEEDREKIQKDENPLNLPDLKSNPNIELRAVQPTQKENRRIKVAQRPISAEKATKTTLKSGILHDSIDLG